MILDYALKTIEQMRLHYSRLSKKEGKRYAALEALRMGQGGIDYVSTILGVRKSTIKKTINEMAEESSGPSSPRSKKNNLLSKKKRLKGLEP